MTIEEIVEWARDEIQRADNIYEVALKIGYSKISHPDKRSFFITGEKLRYLIKHFDGAT